MAFRQGLRLRSFIAALLAACGLVLFTSAPAFAEYVFLDKWGSTGTGDSQFSAPYGIATDADGNVYVSDLGDGSDANDQIRKFTSDGGFLVRWGSEGTGDPRLWNPWGLATDSTGNVYVADTATNYIKKFSSTGGFILKMGGQGTGDGLFSGPIGVATNTAGDVFATDFNGAGTVNRVQKFIATIGGYVYDDQWGVAGSGDGQFNKPHDLATDAAGNIYVSDWGNHRIQKFDSEGFFVTKWGSMGSGDGQLVFPEGIATDSAGNVYVADTTNDRIQKFGSTGDPASGGGNGSGKGGAVGQFEIDGAIVFTKDGRIKFKLKLPAPGIVEAEATVKAPPRPPSLDPDQREHEGHKSALASKKRAKTIVAARAKVIATVPGVVELALKANRKTKEVLSWKHTLKARVTIAYKPTGGARSSIVRSAKFKLAGKQR